MKQPTTVRVQANARFKELYGQLNPEQKQAVDAIEGTVMVLAGPGTGKTQLLAMRIANILQQTQMDPWNILCVTFTESGVVAMRERLVSIMGEAGYYVRIHTFHSFCNEIIQEHPELFAAGSASSAGKYEWQPLSDVERIELLENLLNGLPGTSPLKIFGQPYFYLRDITGHLQSLKQENITPEQLRTIVRTIEQFVAATRDAVATFLDVSPAERTDALCSEMAGHLLANAQQANLPEGLQRSITNLLQEWEGQAKLAEGKRAASKARTLYKNNVKRWFSKLERDIPAQLALADVYEQYQQELQTRGRYDYEDMINQVIRQWSDSQDLLADYQEQFQYILVDEYQDTNGAQNELVRLLGSFDTQPNICVVGDDKQSIYRFQGASLNNMLDFYNRYPAVQVISLQDNYRSQPTVLAAAGAVIANNQESITKYIPGTTATLVPQAGRASLPIALAEVPSVEVEDYRVAQQVKSLLDAGVPPREVAVIVRYHRDSHGVFEWLRRLKVPVRLESGEDALAVSAVQQFLALLQFLHDVRRDDVLAEIIHFSWLGFSPLDVLKVLRYAGVHYLSLWSVLEDTTLLQAAGVADVKPWQTFVGLVATWRAWQRNTSLQNFLHGVLKESGLLASVLQPTADPVLLPAMRRLLDETKAWNTAQHDLTLAGFLQAVQRLHDHDLPLMTRPYQVGEEAVRVLTAHKAKGLEFEHVFLLRVIDKRWGNNPTPTRLGLPAGLVRYDLLGNGENNEDERRLFYVALTRAKAALHLSYARHNEQGRPTVPSLFLHEFPPELLQREEVHEEFSAGQERLRASLHSVAPVLPAEIATWVRAQLQNYVMSVTHLHNYLTCPRMFYVRNVLRVPAARSVHQALGTAVHGALNEFLQQAQAGPTPPSKEWFVATFDRYAARELLSPAETRDVLDVGRVIVAAYFDQYAGSFTTAAVSEFDFSSHGVRVGEAAITGKIDKIEWLDADKRQANVVDYKTGQPDGKAAALKPGGAYHQQLVFYKLLCDLSPRFPHEMVSGEIDFVQRSRQGKFVKKRIAVTGEDTANLRETITRVWDEVVALRFLDPATWCGECEYCQS